MDYSLIIPAFVAGLLTFLAPCTLPLVPGYLGFISGVSFYNRHQNNLSKKTKILVFLNGLLYVLGFSLVFIFLGTLFSWGGTALIKYRIWLSRIGGIFVIIFGLNMIRAFDCPLFRFLNQEKRWNANLYLKPGRPLSSLLFGAAFAFGWTPCIGPLLGTILLLASSHATVGQGAILLAVFSLGLAVPFLVIALGIEYADKFLPRIHGWLHWFSILGAVMLMIIGVLLLTNKFNLWISYFYFLNFFNYRGLLQFF